MKNNLVLKLAIWTAKFIRIMVVFLGCILIITMILWSINPDWFSEFYVLNEPGGTFKIVFSEDETGIPLSRYSTFFLYFSLIKALSVSVVLLLVLNTALRIIRSIKDLQTFRKENVESFRKMGFLFLAMLLLNAGAVKEMAGNLSLTTQVLLNYAVYALICFVLAEIFKEGNRLHEENQLTI